MKALVIGDIHARETKPSLRTDENWLKTQALKLRDIAEIAKEEDVGVVFFLGDIFDSPFPTFRIFTLVAVFLKRLKERGIHCYTVIGNHDCRGYNIDTYSQYALGSLERLGLVERLETLKIDRYWIKAIHTRQNPSIEDYDCDVVFTHDMISDKEVPYECLLADDLNKTGCKIIFSGHNHNYFVRGKVVNPGSILRIDCTESDVSRRVHVFVLYLSDQGISYYERVLKSALPGRQVFDVKRKELIQERAQFLERLKSLSLEYVSAENVLRKIKDVCLQLGFGEDVIREAQRRVQNV